MAPGVIVAVIHLEKLDAERLYRVVGKLEHEAVEDTEHERPVVDGVRI